MNNSSDEDGAIYAASERHAQIMKEMNKFFNHLALLVILGVVVLCGFVIFLLVSHPFWRYP